MSWVEVLSKEKHFREVWDVLNILNLFSKLVFMWKTIFVEIDLFKSKHIFYF